MILPNSAWVHNKYTQIGPDRFKLGKITWDFASLPAYDKSTCKASRPSPEWGTGSNGCKVRKAKRKARYKSSKWALKHGN